MARYRSAKINHHWRNHRTPRTTNMNRILYISIASICITIFITNRTNHWRTNVRYLEIRNGYNIGTWISAVLNVHLTYRNKVNPGDIFHERDYMCNVFFDTAELTTNKQHLKIGGRPIQPIISTRDKLGN